MLNKQQDTYPPGESYQMKTLDMALNNQGGGDNTWEYDEIILERGGSGLGFSIGKCPFRCCTYSVRSRDVLEY